MSRNGSGTYTIPVNSWNPATNGVAATAADWQAIANDLASALTQSVSADGQTPITGNIPMSNNKLTGLGAGNAVGNSLRWEQLFSQGTEADIASASTVDIGAQNTTFLRVTGTTTITSFGTNFNGPRYLRFAGILTLTNSGALILPGGANIITAAGDTAIAIPVSGGWYVLYQRAAYLSSFLRNYHQGFTLSTAGASTTITIGTGQCADSTNVALIDIASSIAKTTATWVLGAGGALSNGAIANSTWYHFYAIRNPSTGVADVVCDTSATFGGVNTSIIGPAGFTQGRYIGSWRTNGSGQWEDYYQIGDDVRFKTLATNTLSVATGGRSLHAIGTPSIKVTADVNFVLAWASNCVANFIDPEVTSTFAPIAGQSPQMAENTSSVSSAARMNIRTNASGQISARHTAGGSVTVFYTVFGFNISEAKGR